MKKFIVDLMGSKRTARLLAAKRIRECFKDVEWRTQRFVVHGTLIDVDGEIDFYKVGSIKAAIARMDAVLADLSR